MFISKFSRLGARATFKGLLSKGPPTIRSNKSYYPTEQNGYLKPSNDIALSPPSSGKTTLLLALAGKLGSELHVSGRVTYNGHEMNEFFLQRTSAYTSQRDLHIGEMTVRETLAFSARCQGVGANYDSLKAIQKTQAKNDPAFKEIDKLIAYVRAARVASSFGTKAKAEAKGGSVLN